MGTISITYNILYHVLNYLALKSNDVTMQKEVLDVFNRKFPCIQNSLFA